MNTKQNQCNLPCLPNTWFRQGLLCRSLLKFVKLGRASKREIYYFHYLADHEIDHVVVCSHLGEFG